MITNPVYGGAYAYGKRRAVTAYEGSGVRVRAEPKPRAEWLALKPGAHEGCVDWKRGEAMRTMVSRNMPVAEHPGAAKHGAALLSGLLRCRRCGIPGRSTTFPRYACCRVWLDQGEPRCIAFGGLRADDGIEAALLEVVGPGAVWGGYEVVDT